MPTTTTTKPHMSSADEIAEILARPWATPPTTITADEIALSRAAGFPLVIPFSSSLTATIALARICGLDKEACDTLLTLRRAMPKEFWQKQATELFEHCAASLREVKGQRGEPFSGLKPLSDDSKYFISLGLSIDEIAPVPFPAGA